MRLLEEERGWYREHADGAAKFVGEYAVESVESYETAAWIAVARAFLNLDEFVTRE